MCTANSEDRINYNTKAIHSERQLPGKSMTKMSASSCNSDGDGAVLGNNVMPNTVLGTFARIGIVSPREEQVHVMQRQLRHDTMMTGNMKGNDYQMRSR